MLITAIQVRSIENTGTKLRGIASVTLDGMVVIHEIKILENQGTMFLAMPSKSTKSGFKDIVHPINADARGVFERLIIAAYKDAIGRGNGIHEIMIREEAKTKDFLALEIADYTIRREEKHAAYAALREEGAANRTVVDEVSKKKSGDTVSTADDDLMKWLQG